MKILTKNMELEFKSPCKDAFACSLACNQLDYSGSMDGYMFRCFWDGTRNPT